MSCPLRYTGFVPRDSNVRYSAAEERMIARKFVGCSVDVQQVNTTSLTVDGDDLKTIIQNTLSNVSSGSYTPIFSVPVTTPPGGLSALVTASVPFTWTRINNIVDVTGIMVISTQNPPLQPQPLPAPPSQVIPPGLCEFDISLPFPALTPTVFGSGVFLDLTGDPLNLYPGPQYRMAQIRPIGLSLTDTHVFLQGNIPHDGALTVNFRFQV